VLAPRKLRLPPGMTNLPLDPYIGRPRPELERRLRYLGACRADVAQPVEHRLPKPRVAGSIPVVRSSKALENGAFYSWCRARLLVLLGRRVWSFGERICAAAAG
jgi:hypothetical protein